MTTRNYRLTVNAVIGTDQELEKEDRRRLQKALTIYLNRNFKLNLAVDHASNGRVRITGPAHFTFGGPRL